MLELPKISTHLNRMQEQSMYPDAFSYDMYPLIRHSQGIPLVIFSRICTYVSLVITFLTQTHTSHQQITNLSLILLGKRYSEVGICLDSNLLHLVFIFTKTERTQIKISFHFKEFDKFCPNPGIEPDIIHPKQVLYHLRRHSSQTHKQLKQIEKQFCGK